MRDEQRQAFIERWDEHVHRLIDVSAKKAEVVDAKHQQIVEGACKVFFEKGFHPTTIREIATASGMSMGQMYHYISSKDDVLFLIHKHMQTSWYNRLTTPKIDNCKDPLKKLEMALKLSIAFLFEKKDLIQFIYTESKYLSDAHLKVVLEMDDKNVSGYWRHLLGQVFDHRGIDTDVRLAGNLISFHQVFVALRGWSLKDKSRKEMIDFMVEFVFLGLRLPYPPNKE